jgi:hypothetical protein
MDISMDTHGCNESQRVSSGCFFPPYASKVSDSVAAVSLSFQVDFSYEAGAENILSFKAMLKG